MDSANQPQPGQSEEAAKRGKSAVFPFRMYQLDLDNLQIVIEHLQSTDEYMPVVNRQTALRWALWRTVQLIKLQEI